MPDGGRKGRFGGCQKTKYQPITDILNPLGIGEKVSFTILGSLWVTKAIGYSIIHRF